MSLFIDIDECISNNGRGPCSDICNNYAGGYLCTCSVPGYKIDESDRNNCVGKCSLSSV